MAFPQNLLEGLRVTAENLGQIPVSGLRFNAVMSCIIRMIANNYTMKLHHELLKAISTDVRF
jgi:hypothetical protein